MASLENSVEQPKTHVETAVQNALYYSLLTGFLEALPQKLDQLDEIMPTLSGKGSARIKKRLKITSQQARGALNSPEGQVLIEQTRQLAKDMIPLLRLLPSSTD